MDVSRGKRPRASFRLQRQLDRKLLLPSSSAMVLKEYVKMEEIQIFSSVAFLVAIHLAII